MCEEVGQSQHIDVDGSVKIAIKNSITKSLVQDTSDRDKNKNKSVVSVHYIPFWPVLVMCLPGEQEVTQLYTNALIICSSTTHKQIPLWNEQPRSVSLPAPKATPEVNLTAKPARRTPPCCDSDFQSGFYCSQGKQGQMEFWVGRHHRHTADSHELL